MNLYGFVGNNGVNNTDLLGLRPPDETVSSCVIKIFAGHGLGTYKTGGKKVTDPVILKAVDVPVNIKNEPCSAASVISCSAAKFANVDTPLPGYKMAEGLIDILPYSGWTNAQPEDTFCGQIKRAIEAAKKHAADDICKKGCCGKIKIEVWIFGNLKETCPRTMGEDSGGYRGWVVDCSTGVVTDE